MDNKPKQTKKKAPKVYKVKDPEPSQRFEGIHENLPALPSLCLIIGSVRSAKSNLICNLLMNPEIWWGKKYVACHHPI